MSKFTWNEENTAQLVEAVGTVDEVSQEDLANLAESLGTTSRSVGAKLRKMDYNVAKATAKESAWTDSQEAELVQLVQDNANQLTYAEIAAAFQNGVFTAKQIQGKLLSLEMFGLVRKAERKVTPKKYTDEEEANFIELANSGATIESLSGSFNRPVGSIRGKALSLLKGGFIKDMPKQEKSAAKERADIFEGLDIENLTVEEIAASTERSERGIKSTLSRRGIACSDYDGAARRAKLDAKED